MLRVATRLIRHVIKRSMEVTLSATALPRVALYFHRNDMLVLAYHNIVPDGSEMMGEASLHLPQRRFGQQLDALSRTHEIVELSSIVEGAGGSGRPRAAITFDDAYAGAVTAGLQEVVARALPATVFVPTGLVGTRGFWWDLLAHVGELEAVREFVLTELRGEPAAVSDWMKMSGRPTPELPSHAWCASLEQLEAAAKLPRISIAPHSWTHANLAVLPHERLTSELQNSLLWLQHRFDNVLPFLACPYGRDTLAVQRTARSSGYTASFKIAGGWIRRSVKDPYAIPRFNVGAGLSGLGFRLRTAGVLR
jgi:peptidoglycan/xylan/chitin deacetylase (PgdA/CDA1 family)